MYKSNERLSAFHKGQILTEGLILVREDICDWINLLFQSQVITGDTFLPCLHNGILLCDFVHKLYLHISSPLFPSRWPKVAPSADRKASIGSFKAKDNITLFLNWCRAIGLSNTILFETKGLTNSDEEKNIVLTMLHIGEYCVDLDIPIPEFAKFHKEMMIAKTKLSHTSSVYGLAGETSDLGSTESESISARSESNLFDNCESESSDSLHVRTPKLTSTKPQVTKTKILRRKPEVKAFDKPDQPSKDKTFEILRPRALSQLIQPTDLSLNRTKSPRYVKNNMRTIKLAVDQKTNKQKMIRSKSRDDINKLQKIEPPKNESDSPNIDLKIKEITNRCQCHNKFVVERTTLHEGMYKIGSKNIFVRMFRGNIMLRVGGGWETLNEYMNKVDPCCKGDNNNGTSFPRRQSLGINLSTDLTPDGLLTKNLRKLSQCELTSVKRKIVLPHSTICK